MAQGLEVRVPYCDHRLVEYAFTTPWALKSHDGIRLLDAPDAWTTPWHSAALRRTDGTWALRPGERAARLGRLVYRDDRPSHFGQR